MHHTRLSFKIARRDDATFQIVVTSKLLKSQQDVVELTVYKSDIEGENALVLSAAFGALVEAYIAGDYALGVRRIEERYAARTDERVLAMRLYDRLTGGSRGWIGRERRET